MPVVNARGEIYEVDRESRVNAWDFRRVRSYTVIAFSVWRFLFPDKFTRSESILRMKCPRRWHFSDGVGGRSHQE